MTDRISKEHRSWNMSQIRDKNTTPEILLRKRLHKAGYRFRLHTPSLPGKPDIVLKKYKTVIFVHGCFWHRHKNCPNSTVPKTNIEFWANKFRGTVKRDRTKQAELKKAGWQVITVWECQLKKDLEKAMELVRAKLIT